MGQKVLYIYIHTHIYIYITVINIFISLYKFLHIYIGINTQEKISSSQIVEQIIEVWKHKTEW